MTLHASLLEEMPDRFEELIREFPPEALVWKPESWAGSPGEGFAAIEHACHVGDIESEGYHVRIVRMMNEERPDLISIDGNLLAVERRYLSSNLEAALEGFRAARGKTVHMLAGLKDKDLQRRGTFAEYGELTLEALIHYLSSHDAQHLACLSWLLGKWASR